MEDLAAWIPVVVEDFKVQLSHIMVTDGWELYRAISETWLLVQVHVCAVRAGPEGVHRAALLTHGIEGCARQAVATIYLHAAEAVQTAVEAQLDPFAASWRRAHHCRSKSIDGWIVGIEL